MKRLKEWARKEVKRDHYIPDNDLYWGEFDEAAFMLKQISTRVSRVVSEIEMQYDDGYGEDYYHEDEREHGDIVSLFVDQMNMASKLLSKACALGYQANNLLDDIEENGVDEKSREFIRAKVMNDKCRTKGEF